MFRTMMMTTIVLIVLSACGGSKNGNDNQKGTQDLLSDESTLKQAQESLKNMPTHKGKEIQVFQDVSIYNDGRIMINIQDPEKPENIDHYEYKNGKWSEPEPVQITGDGDMSANLTPLKDIDFTKVPGMIKIYEEKVKEVEASENRPISMTFQLSFNQERYWSAGYIKSPRAEYSIEFNVDGSLKEFKKR